MSEEGVPYSTDSGPVVNWLVDDARVYPRALSLEEMDAPFTASGWHIHSSDEPEVNYARDIDPDSDSGDEERLIDSYTIEEAWAALARFRRDREGR